MYLSKAIWTKSKWKIMMNFSWRQERHEGHSILIFDDLLSYHFDIHFVVAESFICFLRVCENVIMDLLNIALWRWWKICWMSSCEDKKRSSSDESAFFFLLLMIECKMKMWICWEKWLQNWCFRQFHILKWIETFLI